MAINTFISEAMIEQKLEELAEEAVGQQWMLDFLEKEPVLSGFLYSDDLKVLEEVEKSLFSYMVVTIWSSVSGDHYVSAEISPEAIDELEEASWEKYMGQKGGFREKLDVFFDGFTQEDLLAFVEDMLETAPDESELTREGKELIFIKVKTMLDVLMA